MESRQRSQRSGAIWLIVIMALLLGGVSGVILTSELGWLPQLNAQSNHQTEYVWPDDPVVQPSDFLLETQESFGDIIEAVRPAVVSIQAQGMETGYYDMPYEDPFEFFFDFPDPHGNRDDRDRDRNREPEEYQIPSFSSGSGFFVDPDGYIMTNNHVVTGATEITIFMDDGTSHDVEIVGTDPETDIAILHVTDSDEEFPFLRLGDSDETRVGDWVMAIGNPFGNLAGTVTVGIISATHREYLALPGNTYYQDFIQTDAAINFGNSGGPMVDIYGRAVGINTAITAQGSGIGFAIPINLAKFVYEGLMEQGEVVRGWIGVTIQNLDGDMAAALGLELGEGTFVAGVTEGFPAEEAGLQPMDVILEVDGEPVSSTATTSRIIAALPVNEPTDFLIWRDGEEMTIEVTPVEREGEYVGLTEDEGGEEIKPERVDPDFGMDLEELSNRIIRDYDLPQDIEGIIITDVEIGGIAWEKGLMAGMIIVTVNGDSIATLDDYDAAMDDAREAWDEDGTPVMIEYMTINTLGEWASMYMALPFE